MSLLQLDATGQWLLPLAVCAAAIAFLASLRADASGYLTSAAVTVGGFVYVGLLGSAPLLIVRHTVERQWPEPTSIVIILVPLIVNVARAVGIDLVHLGVILCVNCAIGMFTPPFGMNLFVASGLGNVRYAEAVRGALPLVWLALLALVIVNVFPEISLWLPRSVMSGL